MASVERGSRAVMRGKADERETRGTMSVRAHSPHVELNSSSLRHLDLNALNEKRICELYTFNAKEFEAIF